MTGNLNSVKIKPGKTSGISLLIMLGLFVALMCITLFLSSVVGAVAGTDSRIYLYAASMIQAVVCFGGTAYLSAYFISDRPVAFLQMNRPISLRAVAGIVLFYIVGLPAMNQLIYWNSIVSLPESMSALEHLLREMEEANAAVAANMLNSGSWLNLAAGVMVVGVLTGICEEMLFRGCLQNLLSINCNRVVALWMAAIIFSAIHFQFFGFLPRVMLGAWFGYLLLWSGSLWNNAFAHALNNSVVVVVCWLKARGMQLDDVDNFGVATSGIPYMAIASTIALILLFTFTRKYFFRSDSKVTFTTDSRIS